VESEELARRAQELDEERVGTTAMASMDGAGTRSRVLAIEVDGRLHEVRLRQPDPPWAEAARRHRERAKGLTGAGSDAVVSPMQGTVLEVEVADGDAVEAGSVICVVEAMKMENPIVAHADGVVSELGVAVGEQVGNGQVICVIRPED
jgi:acetyl-CoA/propionyl-CoA carboxylase biotin carboxyl carrier protein